MTSGPGLFGADALGNKEEGFGRRTGGGGMFDDSEEEIIPQAKKPTE